MCRARRRQSRESRDEPPRGNVRRGGACVGSVPAANEEGGRLLVVKLGESLLESPSDGRRAPRRSPLSAWPRTASCASECIAPRSLSSTVTSACCFSTCTAFLSVLLSRSSGIAVAHPDAAAFTELYSPALSLCVVLEQLAMLPIMLGGIQ